MTGWISLHRSIEDHWTFKEKRTFSKFEAWIDLLLMVNHKDNKVLLGNELVTVKRGQKITSIRKLCDRWVWSNNKVKNFLNLLEEDGMLTVKSDTKKTVLTIVNYDLYQNENLKKRHQSDGEATPERHDSDTNASRTHTNNNDNNELIMSNKEDKVDYLTDDYKQMNVETPAYQKVENYFISMNQRQTDDLIFYIGEYKEPNEIIGMCIEIMKERKNKNWNYMIKILNEWREKNLKTLADVKSYEANKWSGIKKLKSSEQKSEWGFLDELAGEENG